MKQQDCFYIIFSYDQQEFRRFQSVFLLCMLTIVMYN
jgi:hypothetical protein